MIRKCEPSARQVLKAWSAQGFDAVGAGEYVYPVRLAEIPVGAINLYAPIDSPRAEEFIRASQERGYCYHSVVQA